MTCNCTMMFTNSLQVLNASHICTTLEFHVVHFTVCARSQEINQSENRNENDVME